MKIIIVGGGKVGYYLTKTLLEHNHHPTVIESDKRLCEKVATELDTIVIHGDGTDPEVLTYAGIEKADAVIGVTGRDENNLICCQIAKKLFSVQKTIARVNNPKNAEILKSLGVDSTVSNTAIIANIIEREADNRTIKQVMNLDNGELTISELTVTKDFLHLNKLLREIPFPENFIVATVTRDGHPFVPSGDTQIQIGDKLMVICNMNVTYRLNQLFQGE